MDCHLTNNMPRQQCDSYFVESDDLSERRHYEAIIKRQRQDRIADELSLEVRREYMADIVEHMATMEKLTLPDVASIDIQEEIQWFMRPYLLDFLVEAHTFFQLLPETMFLAINLLDRYCSRRVVYKRHYQLVGCAALLIAAKYGDRKDRVPLIKELKTMCCMLYDEEMFTQMEWHVLNTLDWVVGHPTVDSFLQLALSSLAEDDVQLEHMTWYICEIALYHRDFVSTKPSVMARAALALARGILGRPEIYEDHTEEENVCIVTLCEHLHQPSEVLAKKYATPYMSNAASILAEFVANQAILAQQRQAPQTPPSDYYHEQVYADKNDIYSTPQKPSYPNVVNGYATPPITPDGDHLSVKTQCYPGNSPRRPITPTPTPLSAVHSHYYQPQQQYATHQYTLIDSHLGA